VIMDSEILPKRKHTRRQRRMNRRRMEEETTSLTNTISKDKDSTPSEETDSKDVRPIDVLSRSVDSSETDTRGKRFEYLDHTADVQLHAWGTSLGRAFESVVLAMFGYITNLDSVKIDPELKPTVITAKGRDMKSLLYNFMDEFLYIFSTEDLVFCDVEIVDIDSDTTFSIRARARGERFDLRKHPQGTEVKAITYSAMQIHRREEDGRVDVFVVVDI